MAGGEDGGQVRGSRTPASARGRRSEAVRPRLNPGRRQPAARRDPLIRRKTSAKYAPGPQQGSSARTFSASSPSAMPRSSLGDPAHTRTILAHDLRRVPTTHSYGNTLQGTPRAGLSSSTPNRRARLAPGTAPEDLVAPRESSKSPMSSSTTGPSPWRRPPALEDELPKPPSRSAISVHVRESGPQLRGPRPRGPDPCAPASPASGGTSRPTSVPLTPAACSSHRKRSCVSSDKAARRPVAWRPVLAHPARHRPRRRGRGLEHWSDPTHHPGRSDRRSLVN